MFVIRFSVNDIDRFTVFCIVTVEVEEIVVRENTISVISK